MFVKDYMKTNVFSIHETATIQAAAQLFANHHIGTLPVIDDERRLVGILHMRDLLKLVMPTFIHLFKDFDFVRKDFGQYEELRPSPEMVNHPITEVMEPPVRVQAESGLLRAFALLDEHDMYDLPVVDAEGRLVGLASRVDIGTAVLAGWQTNMEADSA